MSAGQLNSDSTQSHHQKLAAPLHSRSSQIVVIVKELQFDFELWLEEGEKPDVVSQCLNQSFSSLRSCESTPARRELRGGNFVRYAKITLYSILVISNQESKARRSHSVKDG